MKRYLLILLLLPALAPALDLSSGRIDDSYVYSGFPDNNWGANTEIVLTGSPRYGLIRIDSTWVDSVGTGQTIDSMIFHVRTTTVDVPASWYAYAMWKPGCWVESTGTGAGALGGVSYNDWNGPDNEWGTAGCNTTGDVGTGSFNCTDAGGYDREATAYDSLDCATAYTWVTFYVRPSFLNGAYTNHKAVSIWLRLASASGSASLASTENTQTSWRPWVSVFYHTAEAPAEGTSATNQVNRPTATSNRGTVTR